MQSRKSLEMAATVEGAAEIRVNVTNIPHDITNLADEVVDAGARVLVDHDADLPEHLRREDDELDALECTDSAGKGALLREMELPVLVEIFLSSQEYFDLTFPERASLSFEDRQAFARKLEEHSRSCDRCRLKVELDSNWKDRVDFGFEQYRRSISNVA